MSVFNQPEQFDSAEEDGEVEELMGEVEEAAAAAREPLRGEGDEETIMRNFLLKHAGNPNVKFDYKGDKLITDILKLKGTKLSATFNYVRAQMRDAECRGLTKLLVDNIANIVYRIDKDQKTVDRIKQDDHLRELINKKLGSLSYIPDWIQLALIVGGYITDAIARKYRKSEEQGRTLSHSTHPPPSPRV